MHSTPTVAVFYLSDCWGAVFISKLKFSRCLLVKAVLERNGSIENETIL